MVGVSLSIATVLLGCSKDATNASATPAPIAGMRMTWMIQTKQLFVRIVVRNLIPN